MEPFNYEADPLYGAQVIATRETLTAKCLTAAEIDANIEHLKAELDTLGKRMKDWLTYRPRDGFGGTDGD